MPSTVNDTALLPVQTQYVKTSEVKANPNNPRTIKDDKFKKLVQSIQDFPQMLNLRPIVVNDDMVVLGGNMRLKACKEAGLKEVPVIKASDLTEEQQKEFIIKDNVGFGDWDWDTLANEWDAEQLTDWGLDIPDFKVAAKAEEDDFDTTPPTVAKSVLGDLYELNEHRVHCGDSCDADVVSKTLNGKEPYLMVTDPPYGVVYDANWRNEAERADGSKIGASAIGKVSNDDKADWAEAWSLSPARVAYVYHAGIYSGTVQKSLEDCDYIIRSQIIWAKNNFAISRGDYHWKHEPCWYAVKKGNKGNWAGDRSQTTLWQIDKPMRSETGHSTQKPVECMGRAIGNHDGDVYDPFLGSGTTLIASEQLGRKCYGQELDPAYCDVIVKRWVKYMKEQGKPYTVKRNGQDITGEAWLSGTEQE